MIATGMEARMIPTQRTAVIVFAKKDGEARAEMERLTASFPIRVQMMIASMGALPELVLTASMDANALVAKAGLDLCVSKECARDKETVVAMGLQLCLEILVAALATKRIWDRTAA